MVITLLAQTFVAKTSCGEGDDNYSGCDGKGNRRFQRQMYGPRASGYVKS